jgi:uncharacterized protein (DUF2384 family)
VNFVPDPAASPDQIAAVRRRAEELWDHEVAELWMQSANAHLGGARPVDVLLLRGPDEVLDALAVTEAGGFA